MDTNGVGPAVPPAGVGPGCWPWVLALMVGGVGPAVPPAGSNGRFVKEC